ncbi:hypothetical protein AAA443_00510 [Staphylococcus equorum]
MFAEGDEVAVYLEFEGTHTAVSILVYQLLENM